MQILQASLATSFLNDWLQSNLIQLQIALLAINSATLGVVLTKIRDLVDRAGVNKRFFVSAKDQMLLSIKEQVALIVAAILLLTIWSSAKIAQYIPHFDLVFSSLVSGVFVYSLWVLYDTAKSIVVIVDYSPGDDV